jgi:hypothetical protein
MPVASAEQHSVADVVEAASARRRHGDRGIVADDTQRIERRRHYGLGLARRPVTGPEDLARADACEAHRGDGDHGQADASDGTPED